MSELRIHDHVHQPLHRVVAGWCRDPLDASASRGYASGMRWNSADFPALYCCCSEWVARGVALDRLRLAGVDVSDLQPEARPQLVEIAWSGPVIDLTSAGGLAAAGFPPGYPEGVSKQQTRRAASEWHATGACGVVYRSAAMQRRGHAHWAGPHQHWSEVAIFPDNSPEAPVLLARRQDLDWLR